MLAWLSLLLLAAPPSSSDMFERISPQEAAQRITRCGLGPVTIRYEAELEEDVLVAAPDSATDDQLICADKAASQYTLELPPNLQSRFQAISYARQAAMARVEARAWLSARGLLARVPEYRAGKTNDAVFTRQVETLCGPRARGAFRSRYGPHALSPDWAKRQIRRPDQFEVFTCLSYVTAAAGYEFRLIGNEAYRRQSIMP